MPYNREEGGRLNNFATEPKMYQGAPPTKNEQRNYIIAGIGAIALVIGLIVIAISAS